jgi:hypothetical protein
MASLHAATAFAKYGRVVFVTAVASGGVAAAASAARWRDERQYAERREFEPQ